MPKKRGADRPGAAPSDMAGRIAHLLAVGWGGNQNEMARDIRCSQSSLSRVIHREVQPGARLLKLIGDHPRVNQQWLQGGEGEPLLVPTEAPPPQSVHELPVCQTLLPGKPGDHHDRLAGHNYPVAATLFRPSRCWLEVTASAGILRNEQAHLAEGDLLLLEYDLDGFTSLSDLGRRIAVAWVKTAGIHEQRHLEVGILEYYFGPDEQSLELVVGEPDFRRWRDVKYLPASITVNDEKAGRTIVVGTTTAPVLVNGQGTLQEIPENAQHPVSYRINHEDIVAVCVGMFRRV